MTMFTFYLCKEDGSAASFEAFELASDQLARERATAMLAQHTSCAYVNAWRGERKIWSERREVPHLESERLRRPEPRGTRIAREPPL